MRQSAAGFSTMLVITMAMSVISFYALLVVASELQDEFDISKLQIGLLAAVNTGVGGLLAPLGGRTSDRLGGRRAMALVLLLSGGTSILIALAPSYGALLGAMAVAGLCQGLGNPATNRAIATGIAAEKRGVQTGVKQSGVQLAVFITGFTMPAITSAYGWRTGIWMMSALAFATVPFTRFVTELPMDTEHRHDAAATRPAQLPTFVTQVAIYGFLLGTISGVIGTFLPIFSEEAVGFSAVDAGRVFGISGLVAIPTRVASGILLDRGVSARRMLAGMALVGAVSVMLILAASEGAPPLLWVGTVLAGMTLGSWNTAANLSMIRQKENAGRASGRLIFGFLLGLTVGGPVIGWTIDAFDSYRPAWLASAIVALMGAAVVAYRPKDPARAT